MRDSYVGDVGDFGKYALLNALAGDDLRLGVLWCCNSEPDASQDGRFTQHPELRSCDPNLYDSLAQILKAKQRSLAHVESNNLLPSNTLFYSTAVPAPKSRCFSAAARETQTRLRIEWFNNGLQKLSEADLVFLDPDNGIAGRAKKHWRSSVKYVFEDEIAPWLRRSKSVVVYQHQQRKSLAEQVSGQRKLLSAGEACHVVSFHRRAVRIYYIISADDHKSRIIARLTNFLAGAWGQHFNAIR